MKQFLAVLRFEFLGYLKNKVYVGITIAFVLIFGILLSLPNLLGLFGSGDDTSAPDEGTKALVLVADETGGAGLTEYLNAALPSYRFEAAQFDADSIAPRLESGEAAAGIILHTPLQFDFYLEQAGMDMTLYSAVSDALGEKYRVETLESMGLTAEEAAGVLTAQAAGTVNETGKSFTQTYFYTYVLLFLLYMAVMMYGQLVATSVASEKSSRAMEVLVTTVRPTNLLFGKILGSGLAGLMQLGVILLSAFGFYKVNSLFWEDSAAMDIVSSIFNMPLDILLYTILFFLLGYFFYASLFGALGSLASKVEDINTSSFPVIMLLLAAFLLSFYAMMGSADSTLTVVCSFLPPFAPMVMFVRICMSSVPAWQILVSVGLLIASIVLVAVLAARIYRMGVLMYGKPPKLRDVLRALKDAK